MVAGRIVVVIVKAAGARRDSIVARLHTRTDLLVVATADRAQAGWSHVASHAPDVALINAALGGDDALDLIKRMTVESPATRIIVTDVTPQRETLVAQLRDGVRGFVVRDAPLGDYERAIRTVVAGGYVIPPVLQTRWRPRNGAAPVSQGTREILASVHMTAREREIATMVAAASSDEQVTARLGMTPQTLRGHLQNILEKLTLHTRLHIAAHAVPRRVPLARRSPA